MRSIGRWMSLNMIFTVIFILHFVISSEYPMCLHGDLHLSKSFLCATFVDSLLHYKEARFRCSMLYHGLGNLLDVEELIADDRDVVFSSLQNDVLIWGRNSSLYGNCTSIRLDYISKVLTHHEVSCSIRLHFYCAANSLASNLHAESNHALQMSASSVLTYPENLEVLKFKPGFSRLDTVFSKGFLHGKGWCSKSANSSEFLELDFKGTVLISGTKIQHGSVLNCSYTVETYYLEIYIGKKWKYIKNNESILQIFQFQLNNSVNFLHIPVMAERLRVRPVNMSCSCEDYKRVFCLRIGVFGVYLSKNKLEMKVKVYFYSFNIMFVY